MKKSQLSLLAVSVSVASMLLASQTAFAHAKENYKGEAMPCPVELVLKDGLYIGLDLGYDSYRIANRTTFDDAVTPASITLDPKINATGIVGGGYIGYGKYFEQLWGAYLGLEIFGNWSGAHADTDVTAIALPGLNAIVENDVKVKSNYGIDVLPGIKLNNASLLYVRLGYNWARIDSDSTLINNAVDPATILSNDTGRTRGGFHYGVGIESTFADNWSVRLEYTHTDFSSSSDEDDDDITITGLATSNKVADNQFLMGVSYHFNMW